MMGIYNKELLIHAVEGLLNIFLKAHLQSVKTVLFLNDWFLVV